MSDRLRMSRSVSSRHWTLLIFLASLWGASYLFIKIGLEDLTPATVVFLRTLLAAAVLLPFAAFTGALGGLRENVEADRGAGRRPGRGAVPAHLRR